jgi:tetratricopeptide (TPR) repeat protein
MRTATVAIFLCAVAGPLAAQRNKPVIDPDAKDALAIQQIEQERDPAKKFQMLGEFVVQFPDSPSAAWAYELLQADYLSAKQYDKAIAAGAALLARDPNDLDAADKCVTAAMALNSTDLVEKYAPQAWRLAAAPSSPGHAADADAVRHAKENAEYALMARAGQEADPRKRAELIGMLEALNPHSSYLQGDRNEFYILNEQGASPDKLAAAAERGLAADPNNEDMLLAAAEYHNQIRDDPDRVLAYSLRILTVLGAKPRPVNMSAAAWLHKKEIYMTTANWMAGIILSLRGNYADADRHLRAALPLLKADDQTMGATLYDLGYVNYQLAESGQRERIFDALKFNEQCAALPTTYRDQARKNIASIKSEYNLQ